MSQQIQQQKQQVQGLIRKFNQKAFNEFDPPARKRLKEVLGDFITENPDIYKQDFIINSDKCKYKYLEIQVQKEWQLEQYPYKNVTIHARKAVYDQDTLFLTLNRFLTRGYIFNAASFINSTSTPRRLKKYSREFVYDIPWHRVMNVYISTLDPTTFELY